MISIHFLLVFCLLLIKGNKANEFVNPQNQPVEVSGNYFTQYFKWGSTWRVNDDSPDADKTM